MNPSSSDFKQVLMSARELVQEDLSQTEQVILDVAANAPQGISSRMEQLVHRKGKRIRSTLLCLISHSGEKTPDLKRVSRACAGLELLHLASLVHDDIIDNTELRRGVRTAHKEWGNKIAVLIGDYILSQAMRCVIDEKNRIIPEILSNAANDLIGGEIMELDDSGDMNLSYDRYIKIIHNKTASLVDAAARMGAIFADFDSEKVDACAKMGADFGLAFQIIDDLLDYGIGAENLDKAKFTDIANGLITLPVIFYFEVCSPTEKEYMRTLICRAAEPKIPEEIIRLLTNQGCFEKTKKVALDYLDSALNIAKSLPESKFSEALELFFSAMSERSN